MANCISEQESSMARFPVVQFPIVTSGIDHSGSGPVWMHTGGEPVGWGIHYGHHIRYRAITK